MLFVAKQIKPLISFIFCHVGKTMHLFRKQFYFQIDYINFKMQNKLLQVHDLSIYACFC